MYLLEIYDTLEPEKLYMSKKHDSKDFLMGMGEGMCFKRPEISFEVSETDDSEKLFLVEITQVKSATCEVLASSEELAKEMAELKLLRGVITLHPKEITTRIKNEDNEL